MPADSRLMEAVNLKVDEATLTGESFPIEKETGTVPADAPVTDRSNMVFAGTIITYGRGKAVVVSTGMNTEFGKIAQTIQVTQEPRTPLEIKMEHMGRWLGGLCIIVVALIAAVGIYKGEPIVKMFMLSVALAVAAVPEALPAVMTVGLAMGVRRMAKRNAIVRKLSAVETLGGTTVICSDKTGTMTENKITVREIYLNGRTIEVSGIGYEPNGEFHVESVVVKQDDHLDLLLKAAVLCNDARLEYERADWRIVGDPTEGALIVAAMKADLSPEELRTRYPRIEEVPFSSERKRMTTIHSTPEGGQVMFVKGAPEVVVERCTRIYRNGEAVEMSGNERSEILRVNELMSGEGLRVLGIAYRDLSDAANQTPEEKEKGLALIGLAGMIDPPREEAKLAIKKCREAGVKVVMITGDHKLTAVSVAKELGLIQGGSLVLTGPELDKMDDERFEKIVEDVAVYARVSPEHKVRIVKALKRKGHIVAMTGDGANDAPAIKNADLGVAMGLKGTDVTKEASDMVLADDNFATIAAAVEEGRAIYDNIKKNIAYLLSANIGEILIFVAVLLLGLPFPLTAAQILWINLATDGLPALALGVDPADPHLMRSRPRNPKESLFKGLGAFLIGYPMLMMAGVVLAFSWIVASGEVLIKAQTIAFSMIIMFELFQSFSCRSIEYPVIKIGPFSNKYLILAVGWEILMLSILLYTPFLNTLFNTTPLDLSNWVLVTLAAATGFMYLEMNKWLKTRKAPIIE